ncbi:MAG TPA: NAD(P)-dependent oxidoreductase [Chloroflexota bacterium]|jgi:nucleoside-diphosphate-sugar epimerase|nr:NAD(P)-dependent oxidoreductase [Chloroflexota bacterium]
MKIVLYGAGGPVAAAAIAELEQHHTLRLTDVRPLHEPHPRLADTRGAETWPSRPAPREHEFRQVDVTKAEEVLGAAEGMDAIVNLSVIRPDPVLSFRVNMLGAYHVMQAAATHGIKRVVHTGPEVIINHYRHDFDITVEAPPRPGTGYYLLTKYLGQEVVRAFAEAHELEVIALYFHVFQPASATEPLRGASPFLVSWEDTGRAFRAAVEAPAMPNRYEPFIITTDLPHGKFNAEKAKRLLGWQPRDLFAGHWRRRR